MKKKLSIDEHWSIHSFELQEVADQHIPQWLKEHPNFTLHKKAAWCEVNINRACLDLLYQRVNTT